MSSKFTVQQFQDKFPDDTVCLDEFFKQRYGDLECCPECLKPFKYYRYKNRKLYSCAFCGNDIAPLADTIFHKSSTSLKTWFFAIFLFTHSKNGVSAKELQRQLGVTYKTAWRIAKQIRQLFSPDDDPLCDEVEVDETYMGGKRKGKRGRGAANKTPVIGIIERGGKVKASVSVDTKLRTIQPLINANVKKGSTVYTDEYRSYTRVSLNGFKHQKVKHGKGQYVIGDAHTNTIEGFWSQLKRSINGTYHSVSPKYLQHYVNEFAYRYNRRDSEEPLFHSMVATASQLA
jgi:transposase-like protein